jgi:hypothetical protein
VTRFDLYTYSDYQLRYNVRVYSAEHVDEVIRASITLQNSMEDDDRIGFFLSVKADFLVAGLLYRGCSEFPPVFREFDAIPAMTTAIPETCGSQLSLARALIMNNIAKCV